MKKLRPEIQVGFHDPVPEKVRKYEDTFPEDLPTMEDVKAKYGKVVWCKYTKCQFNEEVEGLQRTTGTILKNRTYNPISEQEHPWPGICTKDEIGIKFDEVRTASGTKFKVPTCFSAVTGVSGHMDFSKLLQGDGTPFGGNIDSQHASTDGFGTGPSASQVLPHLSAGQFGITKNGKRIQ